MCGRLRPCVTVAAHPQAELLPEPQLGAWLAFLRAEIPDAASVLALSVPHTMAILL